MRGGHEGKHVGKNATESVSEFGHALPKTTIPYHAAPGK